MSFRAHAEVREQTWSWSWPSTLFETGSLVPHLIYARHRNTGIIDMPAMGLWTCMLPHLTLHGCCGSKWKSSHLHRSALPTKDFPRPLWALDPCFLLQNGNRFSSSIQYAVWHGHFDYTRQHWVIDVIENLQGWVDRENPSEHSVLTSLFME